MWKALIPAEQARVVRLLVARVARLGFGGVRLQRIEIQSENGAEPERMRFAQTETEGHSEPSFG